MAAADCQSNRARFRHGSGFGRRCRRDRRTEGDGAKTASAEPTNKLLLSGIAAGFVAINVPSVTNVPPL